MAPNTAILVQTLLAVHSIARVVMYLEVDVLHRAKILAAQSLTQVGVEVTHYFMSSRGRTILAVSIVAHNGIGHARSAFSLAMFEKIGLS